MEVEFPSQKTRIRIALVSIIVGASVFGLKVLAVYVSNSAALKSDAIESVVNVVAAVFALARWCSPTSRRTGSIPTGTARSSTSPPPSRAA